eukprot:15452449-Alexandrium_andersonii.AAC.1
MIFGGNSRWARGISFGNCCPAPAGRILAHPCSPAPQQDLAPCLQAPSRLLQGAQDGCKELVGKGMALCGGT